MSAWLFRDWWPADWANHVFLLRAVDRVGAEMFAKTLDDVLADITELKTKDEGLITLTNNIHQQLNDLLGDSLTPDQQAKVDAIFQGVEDRKTEVQAAIDANTPPAPPAP